MKFFVFCGRLIAIFLLTGMFSSLHAASWTEQTGSGSRAWTEIATSSDGVKLVAVVASGYIYTSIDGGVNWTQQTGSGSRVWNSITSSADGTKLVAGNRFYLGFGSNYSFYAYTSTDSGVNWTARLIRGSLNSSASANALVTSSSDGVNLAALITSNGGYTSINSGLNWTQNSLSSWSWKDIASSTDGTKLVAVASSAQIYTSTDSGANWTPRDSQRSWSSVDSSSDGTKLVAGIFTGGGYIYTSTDSGENWIPQTGSGSRNWIDVASSSDGTKLIAATSSGYIYTSTDSGVNWIEETSAGSRNWSSVGISADGSKFMATVSTGYIYTSSSDSTAPTITSVSSDKTNSSYTTGEVIDIDVTFSEAVTSTGSVTVTLETGDTDRTCTFTVSNSTTGTCDYTVQSGDNTSDLTVNTISGTIADQASNAMSDFVPVTNLATNKALVIDTIGPIISETTPILVVVNNNPISYVFNVDEPGTIIFGGSCSSVTTTVTAGSNTVIFNALPAGHYDNCTITATDDLNNTSQPFTISPFDIVVHSGGGGSSSTTTPSIINTVISEPITPIIPITTIPEPITANLSQISTSPTQTHIQCPSNLILTQNLKAGARDGKYHSYTKGIVKEVKILQAHMNRLGFNVSKIDGILGRNTNASIKRMQSSFGIPADGFVGLLTRDLINNSCN